MQGKDDAAMDGYTGGFHSSVNFFFKVGAGMWVSALLFFITFCSKYIF